MRAKRSIRLLAVAAVAAVALSGCTSGSTDNPVSPDVPRTVSFPAYIPYNQTGCSEAIGILFVDPAVAQKGLPPGYTPRDAGDLLGSPQPVGKAAVGFNVVECSGGVALTGEAFEGIFVHSPHLANLTLPPADLDFYQMGYWTGNVSLRNTLDAFGLPTGNFTAAGNAQDVMVARSGSTALHDGGVTVHAFQYVAAQPHPDAALARFWTQTANGTVVFDYHVDAMAEDGVLGGCSFDAASPIARQLGITDCNGLPTSALVFPTQSWTGGIRLLAGQKAA